MAINARFSKLIESIIHLTEYGEFTPNEVVRLQTDSAMQIIEDAGVVVNAGQYRIISDAYCNLLPVPNMEQLVLEICSLYPSYRSYLISLIAGEITRRSLEGAMDLTEEWIIKEFTSIAGELNLVIDELEREYLGKPVSEATPGIVAASSNQKLENIQSESGLDFNAWNKELFGISGNNEAVFQALLSKQVFKNVLSVNKQDENLAPVKIDDLNTDLSNPSNRLVFFPPLYMSEFDEEVLNIQPSPAWRKREYLYSSIPLWAYDEDTLKTTEDVQSALCQHPIPWILIQLGIVHHTQSMLGAGTDGLRLQVQRDEGDNINDVLISTGDQLTHRFSLVLGKLLESLGFRFVLPFGTISANGIHSLITVLLQIEIFNIDTNHDLTLSEKFLSKLYEKNLRLQLVKQPKQYRNTLIKVLGY